MTLPFSNLRAAHVRINRYLCEDRPLNLDEMQSLRDRIKAVLDSVGELALYAQTPSLSAPKLRLMMLKLESAVG